MKKIFLLAIVIFAFVSCEKDNDESNAVDKSLLLGNWEKVEIQLSNYCTDYLEIRTDDYRQKEICTGSSSTGNYINYSLEGKNIMVDGITVYKIEYLSATLLKLVDSNTNELYEFTKPLKNN